MDNAKISQWGIYYVHEVPDENAPFKANRSIQQLEHDHWLQTGVFNPYQKRKPVPYKAIVVSDDIVNHNLDFSTALVLENDKKVIRSTIYPSEIKLPRDLTNVNIQKNIVMGHTLHALQHGHIKGFIHLLLDEGLREQIRQVIRLCLNL